MDIDDSHVRVYPDGTGVDERADAEGEIIEACMGGCREIEPEKATNGRVAILQIRTVQDEIIDRLDDWVKASDDLESRIQPKILAALKSGALMQAAALGLKELGGAARALRAGSSRRRVRSGNRP